MGNLHFVKIQYCVVKSKRSVQPRTHTIQRDLEKKAPALKDGRRARCAAMRIPRLVLQSLRHQAVVLHAQITQCSLIHSANHGHRTATRL